MEGDVVYAVTEDDKQTLFMGRLTVAVRQLLLIAYDCYSQ